MTTNKDHHMKHSDVIGAWAGLAIGLTIVGMLGGWMLLAVPAAAWTGAACVKWVGAMWAEDLLARVVDGQDDAR